MEFDYFYNRDGDRFSYYMLPKIIVTDERFKNLLKDYSYKMIVDGKEYHLDEKYFLKSAVFIGTINSKGEPVVYAGDLGKVFLFDENREAVDVFAK